MARARAPNRCAIITFTNNGVQVIQDRLLQAAHAFPTHIEAWSWFRFLLHELARPYQRALLTRRIEGLAFCNGRSAPYVPRTETDKFFLTEDGLIYSDKISRFVIECNAKCGGAVVNRVAQQFTTIFIDEMQDLAGYDLDLVELLLRSQIEIVLVGDHRQSTFRTNNSAKNKRFAGASIIEKIAQWTKAGLAELKYECVTHRCNQPIADLADSIYPNEPRTVSKSGPLTGHDGTFLVGTTAVAEYVRIFTPQALRYDRNTTCDGMLALNFGESKGMTFDRVLIFPHGPCRRWIETGDVEHVRGSASKLYVAITRARHSLAFVFDGKSAIESLVRYK
jgi:DNA helicase-2/ATP-dependent DNA helicase PcrA